ncbi:MAG: TVP38/TMEM64 family protein [Oscillospiraceae bacterium]|nr:TVP38/TMEM64 family protein [Oscillospiraceae bacterium]
MNEQKRTIIMWTARILPLIGFVVMGGFFLFSGQKISVDAILAYTPSEPILAVLFLWLAFALKSLSLVFPVIALFAVSGQLFPLPIALAVNTVGIAITMTLPYLLGRASELDFSERLIAKYPKLNEVRQLREKSSFFLSFLVRAIGVLACDVVSMYFGSTKMRYLPYITGAVLGFMPDLVCATILGQQIEKYDSPGFWITLAINILCCIGGYLLYRWYKKKKGIG